MLSFVLVSTLPGAWRYIGTFSLRCICIALSGMSSGSMFHDPGCPNDAVFHPRTGRVAIDGQRRTNQEAGIGSEGKKNGRIPDGEMETVPLFTKPLMDSAARKA